MHHVLDRGYRLLAIGTLGNLASSLQED